MPVVSKLSTYCKFVEIFVPQFNDSQISKVFFYGNNGSVIQTYLEHQNTKYVSRLPKRRFNPFYHFIFIFLKFYYLLVNYLRKTYKESLHCVLQFTLHIFFCLTWDKILHSFPKNLQNILLTSTARLPARFSNILLYWNVK